MNFYDLIAKISDEDFASCTLEQQSYILKKKAELVKHAVVDNNLQDAEGGIDWQSANYIAQRLKASSCSPSVPPVEGGIFFQMIASTAWTDILGVTKKGHHDIMKVCFLTKQPCSYFGAILARGTSYSQAHHDQTLNIRLPL